MKIEGDELTYDEETGIVTMKTDIKGEMGPLIFMSDEITIHTAEGPRVLEQPEKIDMEPGSFTGCDLDESHYIFEASSVDIYPGDYLVAYHVFFYEFDGRVPLFYWPVLYINLDEDRANLEFEYGYSDLRGWFGKLTYNHRFPGTPGQLYLDYYQHTGWAGGFKQYYAEGPRHMGFFEFYTQEDRVGLDQLFDWEVGLAHQLFWRGWDGLVDWNYEDYDNRFEFESENLFEYDEPDYSGYLDMEYDRDEYDEEGVDGHSVEDISLAAGYERSFEFDTWYFQDLDLYLDTELDIRDYLEQEDEEEISEIEMELDKLFANDVDMGLSYWREADDEFGEDPRIEDEYGIEGSYSWGDGWYTEGAYEYGTLEDPDFARAERWHGNYTLGRQLDMWEYNLVLERDEPDFPDPDEEEDAVEFMRWPEANVFYTPDSRLNYQLQAGSYYEEEPDLTAYRGSGIVEYNDRWREYDLFQVDSTQRVRGNIYDESPEPGEEWASYGLFESEIDINNEFTDDLDLRSTHEFRRDTGTTPFEFDDEDDENEIETGLFYLLDDLEISLVTGYDFVDEDYDNLVGALTYYPREQWEINMEVEYDLNENIFDEDLYIGTEYDSDRVDAYAALEYDLNEYNMERFLSEWEVEIAGEYGWHLTGEIDYHFDDPFQQWREGNVAFTQRLHCRELNFEYDYVDDEIIISYGIDLFGGRGVTLGDSEEEGFIFDIGGVREEEDD